MLAVHRWSRTSPPLSPDEFVKEGVGVAYLVTEHQDWSHTDSTHPIASRLMSLLKKASASRTHLSRDLLRARLVVTSTVKPADAAAPTSGANISSVGVGWRRRTEQAGKEWRMRSATVALAWGVERGEEGGDKGREE